MQKGVVATRANQLGGYKGPSRLPQVSNAMRAPAWLGKLELPTETPGATVDEDSILCYRFDPDFHRRGRAVTRREIPLALYPVHIRDWTCGEQ